MAMILASAALFAHMKEARAKLVSRAIYEATLEAVYDGIRTADLMQAGDGKPATTTEMGDAVIAALDASL